MSVTGKVKFFNETKGYLSVASCNSGPSPPTNGPGSASFPGECWANTTTSLWQFSYTPDGTNWVEFGALDTVALKWTPYFGGSPIAASAPVTYSVNAGLVTISCPTCLTAQNIPLGQKVGGLGVAPGGLLYAGPFGSQSMVTPFGIGRVPLSNGKGAPSWSQWTVPSSVPAGSIFYSTLNNVFAAIALPACANDGVHALVFVNGALVCEATIDASIATSAVLGNFSGSIGPASAQSVPSCANDALHALTNNAAAGFNCVQVVPTPTRAGDIIYWNGSAWVTLPGNNSGSQFLQENSSGVPAWSAAGSFVSPPQGRLTLVSGTPVMNSNQTAKGTIFYDCYQGGNSVPVYNGSADAVLIIGSCEISDALQNAGSGVVNSAGVFDEWGISVSGSLVICHATNGSGGGWASDTGGANTARGSGYSQLDTTVRSYITNKNAISHCYNGTSDKGPISANQATYLGSFYTTAAGQTGMNYKPAGAAGGAAPVLGLFNGYNRVETCSFNQDTSGHSYATATWRAADNNANNSISWVDGLQMSSVRAVYATSWQNAASGTAGAFIGINLNATTGAPTSFVRAVQSTASVQVPLTASETFPPQLGFNFVQEMEEAANTTASTFNFTGVESLTACLMM